MIAARRRRVALVVATAAVGAGLAVMLGGPAGSETPGTTAWISRPHPSLPAGPTPGVSEEPAMSADGTTLAFSSTSPNLVAPVTTGQTREVYAYDARRPPADPVEQISLTSEGRPAIVAGNSFDPSVSADGRFVAFASTAVLDPADVDETADVYVRDRVAGVTELVSGTVPEGPSGAHVTEPAISADGRYVALVVTEIALSRTAPPQVVVVDRLEQAVKVVSHAPGRADVVGDAGSTGPAISADGGVVTFVSQADNLDQRGVSDFARVMAWTRADDTVRAVSVADGVGALGGLPNQSCGPPAISADGVLVAYACLATNLLAGFAPAGADAGANVFVTTLPAGPGSTALVSLCAVECPNPALPLGEAPLPLGCGEYFAPTCLGRVSISGDGRWLAYASVASNLITGPVEERPTTTTASTVPTESPPSTFGEGPSLAAARGRIPVAAASAGAVQVAAGNTETADTNGVSDVFVRDLAEASTARVSVTSTGGQINDGASDAPSISAEGRWVGFVSSTVALADADCEPLQPGCPPDVFRRDRERSSPITIPPPPVASPRLVVSPGVVRSGRVTIATGTGFPVSTQVEVTFDGPLPPVVATTSPTGTFRAPIVVPHGFVLGPRRAVARAANRTAATGFLVVPPPSDVAVLVEGRRRLGT